MENEEHDKSIKQQHGFIREQPLREHMVRSEGSWELEIYFMCATIYYQSTVTLLLDGHFDNMYHTNATDTVFMAFTGLLLPFLAQEKVEAL